jgi:hypothetical protein
VAVVSVGSFPALTLEIRRRADKVRRAIAGHWTKAEPFRCVVAGGCLNAPNVNDVDLFPVGSSQIPPPVLKALASSKNAATYAASPWPIQVCSYRHETLEALIESFDFAHVQAGAELILGGDETRVVSVAFTQAFVESNAARTSWFTGSAYPLSSLIRAGKYYPERMPRAAYIRAVVNALTAVVGRGFKDWEDFKDQIDAVDLGLLNDEQEEVGAANLQKLFDLLDRKVVAK